MTGGRLKFDFASSPTGNIANPDIPLQVATELHSWLDSGRAMHSVWHRRPGEFAHRETVMVVGW